jgi:hypothetical protein
LESILSKLKEIALPLAVLGGVQFFVMTLLAMYFYPGGTVGEPEATQYILIENFFSDLGRTQDFEGNPNLISRGLFTISLTLQGLIVILFFYAIPTLFPKEAKTKKWMILMTFLGMMSGIGFIGVAHTPWDLGMSIHVFFVNMAFRSLLLAVILMVIRVYKTPYFPNIYGHVLSFVCLALFGYVLLLVFGPAPEASQQGLIIQATSQKIVVYLLILGITFLAYGARRVKYKMISHSLDNK